MRAETLCTAAGLPISGPLLFTPQVFGDDRGFFYESWNDRRFRHDLMANGVGAEEAEAISGRTITLAPSAVFRAFITSYPLNPRASWCAAVGAL